VKIYNDQHNIFISTKKKQLNLTKLIKLIYSKEHLMQKSYTKESQCAYICLVTSKTFCLRETWKWNLNYLPKATTTFYIFNYIYIPH